VKKEQQIIAFLKEQLKLSSKREKDLLKQVRQQSDLIKDFSCQLERQSFTLQQQSMQIKELTATISSMEEAISSKNDNIQSLKNQKQALGKLLSNKSEKIKTAPAKAEETAETCEQPENASVFNPKDRGNNGNSKRKEIFGIEEVIIEIDPEDPAFDKEKAKYIGYTDSVLYKFVPGKFIKQISRLKNYQIDDKVYSGKAKQKSALLNSNYDSSFIAGMLQLRYIYSMPVERIFKYFNESGFDLSKPTAHGLISKSAAMMDRLEKVLKKIVLEDDYLGMDESYYNVLVGEKNEKGKGIRKGYIWAALANGKKLVNYFYEKGSRKSDVFTNYIGTQYKGAIQSDGWSAYKIVETDTYPDVIRLGCFQHSKRKFLDIMDTDRDAKDIVDMINSLYHNEHKIKEDWDSDMILKHRQEYAPPILKELEDRLLKIQKHTQTLPKSPLSVAVNYMLKEFDALKNYTLRYDYSLDNNAIERCHRYISLSRRNSLFCGSHDGAKRMALIYSLACSCRLNNVNTFKYFTDVLNQLANISPNAPDEVFIELLPHRWKEKDS
jgi:Uncharacterized protein conserved in bacteria with the myosin-like domain